jgi:hypothetical protein
MTTAIASRSMAVRSAATRISVARVSHNARVQRGRRCMEPEQRAGEQEVTGDLVAIERRRGGEVPRDSSAWRCMPYA